MFPIYSLKILFEIDFYKNFNFNSFENLYKNG